MESFKAENNFNLFQAIIIISFWALLFASPLLFGRFEEQIDWRHIFRVWINYLPLFILFLINRFILLPKLFFGGKKFIYFVSTLLLIIVISLGNYFYNNEAQDKWPFSPERAGNREVFRPPLRLSKDRLPPPILPKQNPPKPIPAFANFLILAVLLVGFDAGLQISMRWAKLEKEKFKLQKESVENQLALLKNQISPHFFMNTLNNIHALVDINSDEAKESIIKLSSLMRHLLYDSEEELSPIKKEIIFIQSYIELMRLRFTEKVIISVDIPNHIPDKLIPPLLFTSLIENAFKHGISYNNDSFIKIALAFTEKYLTFVVTNSNHQQKTKTSSWGIGLENTRKRLELIYGNNYKLIIEDNEEDFNVQLSIPI